MTVYLSPAAFTRHKQTPQPSPCGRCARRLAGRERVTRSERVYALRYAVGAVGLMTLSHVDVAPKRARASGSSARAGSSSGCGGRAGL